MVSTFNKIIWATDGSNAADLALPLAEDLAKDADAELLIGDAGPLTRRSPPSNQPRSPTTA